MKIAICASIEFTPKIKELADALTECGHEVEIPLTSQKILRGELTLENFLKEKKERGDGAFRKIKDDVIKRYFEIIKGIDALLVLNLEKKSVPGYIGGNTFLEMGFAHVLGKPIYLFGAIPEMIYTDEIKAMQPVVISGDLSKII
ncbi:MAG: hypothetical protein WC831_06400 [Parcubacteria group bacterium]